MENTTVDLKEQLLGYYAKATAASEMYHAKADKVDNFGFQGTENLSPEGVGGLVAAGGLVAKLAFCGAKLVECVANVPESFSNGLNAAALPLNAVAGTAIALGASVLVGSIIKDAISSRIDNKGHDLSDHANYAEAAYYALQQGKLELPEGATVEDAMVAIRDQQVADHLAQGGEEEDIKAFYPEVNMEKADSLIAKVEDKEGFAAAEANAIEQVMKIEEQLAAMSAGEDIAQ